MDSPKLWIYNYDFEFELANLKRVFLKETNPVPFYYLNRSSSILIPFASANDGILIQEQPNPIVLNNIKEKLNQLPDFICLNKGENETNDFVFDLSEASEILEKLSTYQIAPWGWSDRVFRLSESKFKKSCSSNSSKVTKTVNSKVFSHECRFNLLPVPFQVPSVLILDNKMNTSELLNTLTSFQKQQAGIYVKNFFGTAGKLSSKHSSSNFSNRKLKTWNRWIRDKQGILLEKAYNVKKEFSLQIDIEQTGHVLPIAVTEMYNSQSGSYIGNILSEDHSDLLHKLMETFNDVFKSIADQGYSGPVGFDLMETDGNELKLIEINARLNMGRVAVEWHKLMGSASYGFFANLFLEARNLKTCENTCNLLKELAEIYNCTSTLINYIQPEGRPTILITIYIGANRKVDIFKLLNQLKPSVLQRDIV